jgi:hypothetical protein
MFYRMVAVPNAVALPVGLARHPRSVRSASPKTASTASLASTVAGSRPALAAMSDVDRPPRMGSASRTVAAS